MLTPERIDALRKDGDPTQQELKQAALASAAEMVAQPIPEMRDANNRLRRIGDTMPVLGLAYRLTGERRYAEAADRWLQALLAVPEWKGSQNLGRSAWVVGSALLYDWLRDELPESTRARLRERLAGEGELLLKNGADFRLLSNHCLIETSALGMIGLALRDEHPRAAACLQRARERADAIIQYAPLDGSWGEGVQYWQYGLGYFLRYLEASKTAGDRDYYPRYEWLKQTGFFPIHFSLPGQPEKTVDFSDSGENDYVADFLMYLPAAVYRNGYYQDFANKTRATKPYKFSWMDFIAYDPGVKPADFTTLPQFRHFADNGFVIARSGWGPGATLVAFHCGPSPGHRNQADPERLKRRGFGPGHGHPDINSFSLYSHGEWLVLDPGYVHEKWTRDENTVLVNGRGQAGEGSEWLDYMAFQAREPAPKILHAESNEAFDYIIGDAGNVYVEEAGLRHFRRHLLFLKPDVVVILDDLAGKRPAKFEWRLQAKTEPVRAGKDSFEIRREGVRLAIQPLLPMGGEARIETRPLKASATDGKISTLDLAVENVERTTFLVALCVMPGAAAKAERAPEISYTEGKLEIRRGQKSWRVVVGQPDDAHPGARLLRVEE
jgi:hypothetical protein